jgi:hypothetical protein
VRPRQGERPKARFSLGGVYVNPARRLIREPDVDNPRHYRRRVRQLAVAYLLSLTLSITGICLLIANGGLLVDLTQRSNVETLTILFFIVFFGYMAVLSLRGAWGGAYVLAAWWGARRDPVAAEVRKGQRLGRPAATGPAVALNKALERADRPGQPFDIAVRDDAGEVGAIRVDGVKVRHVRCFRHGSSDLLAYFVRQVSDVRGMDPDALDVVSWQAVDEEGWHQYAGLVEAIRNLGARLGGPGGTPWPSVTLSEEDCATLERRMSAVCGAVRDEAFLPQMEYEGEHKLPIIPEPLGMLTLARREPRVDPLSSIGSSLVVTAIVVAVTIWMVLRPPSLPGQ